MTVEESVKDINDTRLVKESDAKEKDRTKRKLEDSRFEASVRGSEAATGEQGADGHGMFSVRYVPNQSASKKSLAKSFGDDNNN